MALLKSFSFSEPQNTKFAAEWDEVFHVEKAKAPPLVALLRVLSGNIDIVHNSSNRRSKCRTIFFTEKVDVKSRHKDFPSLLAKWLSEDLKADDVIKYLKYSQNINRGFYVKLTSEICFCLHSIEQKNYISAFVNLYRAIEWISFAFPNIFFVATDDFVKSYNDMKDMMSDNPKGGELGFFNRTVDVLFDGDPMRDTKFEFNIENNDADVCEAVRSQLKHVMNAIVKTTEGGASGKFSVEFTDMASFIITLRNRYFHYNNSGIVNIQTDLVRDTDLLFQVVVGPSVRWFAQVLLKIVATRVGSHAAMIRASA
jgi:hypothetical protein